MNYKDLSKEHLDAHVTKLIEIAESIQPHEVTILTGGNALGKSVIRKILANSLKEKLAATDPTKLVAAISMQARTESRPEFGGLSTMMHDLPWSSTSESTIHCIKQVIRLKERFIVIDELEIGMSKEVQMGMCLYINTLIPEILENNYGLLIITHSDVVVKTIKHDKFINIEGMNEDEWLSREIVPVNPEDVSEWALELFKTIRDWSK